MDSLPLAVAAALARQESQQLAEAGRNALRGLEWAQAARCFTDAADRLAEVINPHGTPTADEIGLRRDAHLALCRTEQFIKYRTRRPSWICINEWREPSGDLVDQLLPLATDTRVRQRHSATA